MKAEQNSNIIEQINTMLDGKLRVDKISECTLGITNSVYKLETDQGNLVFKANTSGFGAWKIKKEVSILNNLKGIVPVPAVISYKESTQEFSKGYILMSACPGICAKSSLTTLPTEFFVSAAEQLAILHKIIYSSAGFLHDINLVGEDLRWPDRQKKGPFSNEYDRFMTDASEWYLHLKEKGSRFVPLLDVIHQRMQKYENFFLGVEPRFLHDDYCSKNLMYEDHKISGILDFEFSRSGNSSLDVHHFMMMCLDAKVESKNVLSFLETYSKNAELNAHFIETGEFIRYYRAFQKVMILNREIQRSGIGNQESMKRDLKDWMQKLVLYDDPCLNFYKMIC